MKRINVYRVATIGNITIMDKDYGCVTYGHGTTIRILDTLKISPNYLTHYLRSGVWTDPNGIDKQVSRR